MKPTAALAPEIVAIVDLGYARDLERWLQTIRRLSELPHDPTLCVQIRAKSLSPNEVEKTARLAREAFKNRSVTLSWNGDPHIAAWCGFDGCHQPQADIEVLGDETAHLIHSASVHNEASLQRAQICGVDFVIFGPVFKPVWKDVHPQGIDELTRLAVLGEVPIVAIGGINEDSIFSVSQAGASGVACVSRVMDSSDPIVAVTELQARWRNFVNVARSD